MALISPLMPEPHLHNVLSNENEKWYFRDTSYNSWPIVCSNFAFQVSVDLHLHRLTECTL